MWSTIIADFAVPDFAASDSRLFLATSRCCARSPAASSVYDQANISIAGGGAFSDSASTCLGAWDGVHQAGLIRASRQPLPPAFAFATVSSRMTSTDEFVAARIFDPRGRGLLPGRGLSRSLRAGALARGQRSPSSSSRACCGTRRAGISDSARIVLMAYPTRAPEPGFADVDEPHRGAARLRRRLVRGPVEPLGARTMAALFAAPIAWSAAYREGSLARCRVLGDGAADRG